MTELNSVEPLRTLQQPLAEDYVNNYTSLYDLAMLQFNCHQYQDAMNQFEIALQKAQELEDNKQKVAKIANARYMLGQCYHNLGQKEVAIFWYQNAIDLYLELDLKIWADNGLQHLVNLYQEINEYEKAIDCQQQRLRLAQERKDVAFEEYVLYGLGNLYNNQKRDTEAIEYYQQALALAKILHGPGNKANAYYMLGQSYARLKRTEEAINCYQQAVTLYLESGVQSLAIDGLKYLSDLYRELKDYNKALDCQQQRLKLAQDIQDETAVQSSWYNLGCLYQDRNKDEQAIASLTQALTLAQRLKYSSQAADAHYVLGLSHEKLGQRAEAIEQYRHAERLYQKTNTQQKWAEKSSVKLRTLEAKRTLLWGDSQSIAKNSHPHYLQFLEKLLNTDGEKEIAVPLLRANLDKLDEIFLQIVKIFCNELEKSEPKIAQEIANTILYCSDLIYNFPLGQRAINLEISIAVCERILNIFPSDTSNWAYTQNSLGLACFDRIRGEKAENLERAIAAYNAALSVYTREAFPQDWAMTQMNLGIAYTKRIRGEEAENLERAIAYHDAALSVYTREASPKNWAMTQMNLGIAYTKRIRGEKAENVEMAIAYHNAALEVLTRKEFPQYWAMTQNNLGIAYSDRIRGEKAENVEREIASYKAALEVLTRQEFPQYWAMTQKILGTAYRQRIRGEKAENIERAIAAYENALEIYTYESFPKEWARIQYNLGNIYLFLIRGQKAQNLEEAIAYYNAALKVHTHEIFPEDWASTQNNLGLAYFHRILGNKASNLETAIAAYNNALEIFTSETFPVDWAITQYNLALAYTNRIQGNKAENLEEAIATYKSALVVRTREAFPKEWAEIQQDLGIAYNNRIQGDRAENLERAIVAYENALEIYTYEAFSAQDPTAQNNLEIADRKLIQRDITENVESAIVISDRDSAVPTREVFIKQCGHIQYYLGIAYENRIQGDKAENLEIAINYYQAALKIDNRDAVPDRWTDIQCHLGVAYYNRIKGNKADNINCAIQYYQLTLEIYTREAFTEQWAEIQYYLGLAYNQNRSPGNLVENREQEISAYEAALTVYSKEKSPELWANIQNFLGFAYCRRTIGDMAENIEQALVAHELALTVYTQEAFPEKWAQTQNNLGDVYKQRILGNREENLKKALAACKASTTVITEIDSEIWGRLQLNLGDICRDIYFNIPHQEDKEKYLDEGIIFYEKGLTTFNQEYFPERWATAQRCLGDAYLMRLMGMPVNAKNLEPVIQCDLNALKVFTRQAFPREHAKTLLSLGTNYYYNAKRLPEAYDAFTQAIDTVEYLRGEITSGDETKRKLNEEWNQLYLRMVELCLELGNHTAAIEYADRSKARNLVELIATRDAYPQGEIPAEVRQRLQQLRQAIDDEKHSLAQQEEKNRDYTYITQLREELQEKSPYKPLEFQQIQSLLGQETTILEWYILDNEFLTFILTPKTLHFWKSSPEDIKNLIDWTNAYLKDYQTNKTQWQSCLPQRLETLAKILHLDDILRTLFQQFPTCKKLILIPHRYLHLFPIHALPTQFVVSSSGLTASPKGVTTNLIDLFPKGVSYAPSCQILQQAQNKSRPHFNQLFAIQPPTEDLDFTALEVEAIQNYFNQPHILKHKKAEKNALNFKNVHCTHFSCHAYFNFNEPLKSALILTNGIFPPPPPQDDQTRYLPLQNGNLLDLGKCLTLEDILQLDLTECRLVTLSACETGITDFTSSSDEYIGLPSGFILAGSPNVVSSLWEVNDISTALLMIRFYQNLKNGETVSLALKHAQTWLREATAEALYQWSSQLTLRATYRRPFRQFSRMVSTEKPFASPYYWAGFCAIGS